MPSKRELLEQDHVALIAELKASTHCIDTVRLYSIRRRLKSIERKLSGIDAQWDKCMYGK